MEDIESTEESESKIDYVKIIKEGLLFYNKIRNISFREGFKN